jgi:thiamine biosynthesis lipoprotein ApbE/Na+-translocating ferredoxin:NAD+ oxidoreductase RnfG subunit
MNSGRSFCLTLPAFMAAAATLPAAAEVYLNESQALAVVFGENATVHREEKTLDGATRTRLEHSSDLEFPETSYTFFINDRGGRPGGYAVVVNEIGKSEPITFMVGMTPEGKVAEVAIMVFRENRGWEVKEKRFLNQFRGKTTKSSIRVNEDILNYTGATLSSKAVARGVKRALLLLDAFYPRDVRGQLHPFGRSVQAYSAQPLVTTADSHGPLALYRQRRLRMGTICEIRAWCRSSSQAQQAFEAGFSEIERIEQIFSAYRRDSELSVVNREASRVPVEVTEEFFDLTRYAIQSWERSRGAFDISIGPLTEVWGFREGNPHIPSNGELLEARNLVGSDKLILQRRGRTIQFQRQGMTLDFGGLAKGHAAKHAARVARQHGAIAALVNLGGSSLAASEGILPKANNNLLSEGTVPCCDWIVGVTDPGDTSRCALHLVLKPGWCLSTSGTYERQVEIEGAQFSHLIDPRTGIPLHGLRSLTSVARSGRRTEVLAKYLLTLSSAERTSAAQPLKRVDWVHVRGSSGGPVLTELAFQRTLRLISLDAQTDSDHRYTKSPGPFICDVGL